MKKPGFNKTLTGASQGWTDERMNQMFKNSNLPSIPVSKVGRNRLISSFRNKFGESFRNVPGVGDMIKDFDQELDYRTTLMRAKKNGNR